MAAVTGSIENRQFVVMRFKRIKTWAHVYHVRRHNTREMDCPHVDKDAPAPRLIVGSVDVAGEIRKVFDRYKVTPKEGEVLALEFIVTASREVFDGLEGEAYKRRLREFMTCAFRAFCDRFKIDGQIVSVALHEDERTPHLHVVVVPLIFEPDNRRKDKAPIYRLSAKRLIGGRGDMSREQTRFASFFAEMGLERGVERSGSRHVSNREHEAMLEAACQAAREERDGLAVERRRVAERADQLLGERKDLEAERAQIERDKVDIEAARVRIRQDEQRLEADRVSAMTTQAQADALKKRAIDRAYRLRELLLASQKVLAYAKRIPVGQHSPALQEARAAALRLQAATKAAAQEDAWLAAAVAFREGQAGISR